MSTWTWVRDLLYSAPMPSPRPLLEALQKAIDKVPLTLEHKSVLLKAMAPYAYAQDAFFRLFDHSDDLMVICGVDGTFRHVNKAFLDTFGYDRKELTSRPLFDFVHPNDVEITRSKMEKLKSGLDVVHFENRWKTKSGAWKRVKWICPAPPAGAKDLFSLAKVVGDA